MNERQSKQRRKWIFLGAAGLASGLAMLLVFKSLPIASGTAAGLVIAIIVAKHAALFLAVSSPMAALFQSIKPKLREICGKPPEEE